MMKPKKRKGSKLVILSPALRILKLHKRCISVRKQCLNKESSRSKGPLVPCRAIQQRSIKQLKGKRKKGRLALLKLQRMLSDAEEGEGRSLESRRREKAYFDYYKDDKDGYMSKPLGGYKKPIRLKIGDRTVVMLAKWALDKYNSDTNNDIQFRYVSQASYNPIPINGKCYTINISATNGFRYEACVCHYFLARSTQEMIECFDFQSQL